VKLVQLQILATKSLLCYSSEQVHTYTYINREETHTFSMNGKILYHLKKMQVDGGTEVLNFFTAVLTTGIPDSITTCCVTKTEE